mmetsp:Transcript_23425/g.51690  ORF Transcript_23425/g.51690 Transcript_23425/m.51690 type:complete len:205 (+) Transcript_23425:2606-3220(+)
MAFTNCFACGMTLLTSAFRTDLYGPTLGSSFSITSSSAERNCWKVSGRASANGSSAFMILVAASWCESRFFTSGCLWPFSEATCSLSSSELLLAASSSSSLSDEASSFALSSATSSFALSSAASSLPLSSAASSFPLSSAASSSFGSPSSDVLGSFVSFAASDSASSFSGAPFLSISAFLFLSFALLWISIIIFLSSSSSCASL